MARRLASVVLASALLTGCHPPASGGKAMSIAEVIAVHDDELLAIPGVVGVAEGERAGEPCILVLVIAATPELARGIPASLGGYPVVIEETGEIKPL